MIDCEKDCPSGHRKINWFTDVELDAQCSNCYKEQLEKAEAENTALDKENTLINDRLSFKITELGLHIEKVGEQRNEIDKANNALEQLSQEHAATLKWYNDLRDACTVNGNTYTLKSLIAQTERLDDEIAKLKAKVEEAREEGYNDGWTECSMGEDL